MENITKNKIEQLKEKTAGIFEKILLELENAYQLHPCWPSNSVTAAAIVAEEVGELVQSVLDVYWHGLEGERENMVEEAVQTAAMAVRFLLELDEKDNRRKA